ncbi:hypothetical protein DH2020_022029 [Rehmannia glutinosa]|uniref:Uncharacterized protein n=1 Tax=Rehmannia glutinosa TaxID=99300 RepID=A0ABR0WDQ3_REHGL
MSYLKQIDRDPPRDQISVLVLHRLEQNYSHSRDVLILRASGMDIDPDIANWVLEFLLRQPLEDQTLNSLLRALPLPNDNAHLQKSLLLRKLQSEVSRNSISESILELLEQLEEIEFQQGSETVSDAMRRAYCAVAVECTVRLLVTGDDGDNSSKFKFFEAVKRVWRSRVGRMEKTVENGGLGSEELRVWKDEIEAAVWEDSVCESIVKKSDGVNAVEAVKTYLREEREKMGPSFLELVAARVKNDEVLQGILGVESGDRVAGKEAPSCRVGRVDVSNFSNEMPKKKIKLRDKLVGLRRSRGLASGNSRGAQIVDSDEMTTGPSYRNYKIPSSAEVNRVREALDASSSELHAVVKDPLPDALKLAEAISDMASKNKRQDSVEENHVEPNLFIVDDAGVVQDTCRNMSNEPRPSLMERNSSAHTYEWDESIDGSQEDRTCRGRLLLPSPRMINVAPLDRYEIQNLKKRRKGRKWSLVEEDTLRTGVQKYGKGNWKVILTAYHDVFEDRTEVNRRISVAVALVKGSTQNACWKVNHHTGMQTDFGNVGGTIFLFFTRFIMVCTYIPFYSQFHYSSIQAARPSFVIALTEALDFCGDDLVLKALWEQWDSEHYWV